MTMISFNLLLSLIMPIKGSQMTSMQSTLLTINMESSTSKMMGTSTLEKAMIMVMSR